MLERYKEITFKTKTLQQIDRINAIIEEYLDAGYTLTVRQLYYQLVARDIIPNNEKSYKQTTSIVNDARIAGLIDWDAIEDRTRSFEQRSRWSRPQDILTASARQYHTDPWATQDKRLFLVVEKEALVGVFSRVCHEFDVPLLAARGYPSASVVRDFAKREIEESDGKDVVILHFGDHDPSGIDMTRDLEERFELFGWNGEFTLKRMALNLDQIEELKPPPNPAKTTDARFVKYRQRFGDKSWELDALPPTVLSDMARAEILTHVDARAWDKWASSVEKARKKMLKLVEQWKD
ncbi:DNA topoisomerase [Xanthomonas phage AhaSv]|nr:DNA topoisomerase [Xanthomonas phage AhaSv]